MDYRREKRKMKNKTTYKIYKYGKEGFYLVKVIEGKVKRKWALNPEKLAELFDLPTKTEESFTDSPRENISNYDKRFAEQLLCAPLDEGKDEILKEEMKGGGSGDNGNIERRGEELHT